jgi:hypothetical protein
VSDDADDWEYDGSSVRDMACFGFLLSRLALIVIVFANGPLASSTGAKFGWCVKGDNNHGHAIPRQYHATR